MIQFPNNRLTYTGKKGPVYDNDGQNAINNLYSAVNMLLGLSPTGFAILSGFVYSSGSYGSGYFYLNGFIYYFAGGITSGQCLVPNVTQINNVQFSDGISRNTYEVYGSTTSNTATGSTSPLFTNNMDSYRLNLTVLNNLLQSIINNIGSASGNIPLIGSSALNNNSAVVTDGSGYLKTNSNSQASPAMTTSNNFVSLFHGGNPGIINLSSAVPANKLAIIYIYFTSVSTSGFVGTMTIQKNGETNNNNNINLYTDPGNGTNGGAWTGQIFCFVDANSKINIASFANIGSVVYFIIQGYI
jgi:hypothetical protein